MKKLFSLCLASMLFLGSATLFLGCGGAGGGATDEPALDTIETEDPGAMDTTGTGQAEPAAPGE